MRKTVRSARLPRPAGPPWIAAAGLLFVFFFFSIACIQGADKPQGTPQAFHFAKNPEIQQVKPKKPVRIKLHRGAKGEYSWDLSGDSVDDVVRADSRLRKLLKVE
ncbi:MAG: hypothetical protein IT388_11850 [Nitrospirales bacterium]|nr:hypothetical protein [Nitrospirales bacterium]